MSLKDELNSLTELPAIQPVPATLIKNDREYLAQPCAPTTLIQATEIWPVLEATLDKIGGYGLAANQIGIQKRVAIIKYKGEIYKLLNPRIIAVNDDKEILEEGCLSFPKKTCKTLRYTEITIEDDNLGRIDLSAHIDGLFCVIFQHEIDHLDGITIFDRVQPPLRQSFKNTPRNALCPCGSGKKYKKCCM
jgi:peptide deformylase